MSAIDRLIDASVRCILCEKRPSECRCYIRMHCPTCGTMDRDLRQASDPVELAEITFPCPACDQDDGTLPRYLNTGGGEIPFEVMHP